MKKTVFIMLFAALVFLFAGISMADSTKNKSGKGIPGKPGFSHDDRNRRGGHNYRGHEDDRGGPWIIASIAATVSVPTTEAVIMSIIDMMGIDTIIVAIGAHGTSGTGMPKDIPTSTIMATITAIMSI